MTPKTKASVIYILIFVTSLIYAPVLHLWQRADPVSRYQNTWLATVIGCGYVLLYLRTILDLKAWLRVSSAFFFASIPIITRALIDQGIHNRQHNGFSSKARDG